jgi:hypothetical protein
VPVKSCADKEKVLRPSALDAFSACPNDCSFGSKLALNGCATHPTGGDIHPFGVFAGAGQVIIWLVFARVFT